MTILTSGTIFAQALMVFTLPVLTRLYAPEDFSLLAVYVAIIGIATVISSLRYNIAIPLPEKDGDGMALLAISLASATVFSALCALPVIFLPKLMMSLIGELRLQPYLWMVPVGIFVASSYNGLQYWASRRKQFSLITRTRISRAVGGVGTQLGLGAMNSSPFGLIFGHMIYGGLGIFALSASVIRREKEDIQNLTWANVRFQASRYINFPLYSVPEALFNTASIQLPLIIIAAMGAGPETGFLFLAMRVIGLPMSLVGSSVSQVFLVEAPAKMRDGTLSAFTLKTMWTLFKTGGPVLIAVGGLSPLIFPAIFGADWERAGWLVAWLTPWFILQFIVSPVSIILHIQGRLALSMWINAFGCTLRTIAAIIAVNYYPKFAGEAYALAGLAFAVVYLMVILRCVGRPVAAVTNYMK
ncbi:lipopolysaccharide biosynthesis protein [Sulfitobacter pontiacus]|uniref:lipopolysaccharide biosynthesis protein n=1 Tax=Sulfitobacter pontiacus TaxID=60137 RepID=UPI0030EE1A76